MQIGNHAWRYPISEGFLINSFPDNESATDDIAWCCLKLSHTDSKDLNSDIFFGLLFSQLPLAGASVCLMYSPVFGVNMSECMYMFYSGLISGRAIWVRVERTIVEHASIMYVQHEHKITQIERQDTHLLYPT